MVESACETDAKGSGVEYIEIERARTLPGLRLVLTAGVPGPWGEAAKEILTLEGVDFLAVRQVPLASDPELREWTGQTSAPVAVLDDEPPRSGWVEILELAERLAPSPSLVPDDPRERAWMFGLANEICGAGGFGWCRRLMLLQGAIAAGVGGVPEHLGRKYGFDPAAAAAAPGRVVQILELLASQLADQRARGSRFLVGNGLSALDIYWSTFAALIQPLDEALCAMDAGMRAAYTNRDPRVADAIDPALLAHRDFVYREHLSLPLDF